MTDPEPPTDPGRLPDDISFEQWVEYVFVRSSPVPFYPSSEEWWDEDADPARTLAYLTRLFEEPPFLLGRYSRERIDRGLNFFVSNSCSSHMFTLSNETLPWPDRRACFDAMIPLYEKLMAPVYGDTLGHLSPHEVNFSCFMWWDVIPIYGGMNHPDRDRINNAVYHVFEEVLKLKSEACLESALHGLGHWAVYERERTRAIVGQFLRRSDLSPALRRYAEAAKEGMVQ